MKQDLDISLLSIPEIESLDSRGVIIKLHNGTDFVALLANQAIANKPGKGQKRARWWTKTQHPSDISSAKSVTTDGIVVSGYTASRICGILPCIKLSGLEKFSPYIKYNGPFEMVFGEYPQTVVSDEHLEVMLETSYQHKALKETGKHYTVDGCDQFDYTTPFTPKTFIEYEYQGSKYVRIDVGPNGAAAALSDGTSPDAGDTRWIRVEPIKWYVDRDSQMIISKNVLVAGIPFELSGHFTGLFDCTDMQDFLDTYFRKEIIPSKKNYIDLSETDNSEKRERKKNPYGFNLKGVSEEDIIRGAIESNIPVFLHGKAGDGKTARVAELDPDCQVVHLMNETPDSFVGIVTLNPQTGEEEYRKPVWLRLLEEKCETEPDKIHIVFFDELTNALHSMQGMALDVILNKKVRGLWKLPENARIVAAGNEVEDSMAANGLIEPMFDRFAHAYIQTTVDNWLKWATTSEEEHEPLSYKKAEARPKMHPAIIAFISYHAYLGNDVLRTPYDGVKPNADPRKWEMASKMLYTTGKPEMLRALIGESLTREFTAFVKQSVITVEDVINHNYSDQDLDMDVSEKFSTAVGLAGVDIEHFGIVRDFMTRLGPEPRATFESIWARGNEERLEVIAEAKMADVEKGGKGYE